VSTRKNAIQDRFRDEMGLYVDMPKQGSGNTNDGNSGDFSGEMLSHPI